MDSATRDALLAAMTAAPAGESVASVAKPISALATDLDAKNRTNPPFVSTLPALPAKESDPATMPPEIPGWAEPDLMTDLEREFSADASAGDPVFLATLATRQQTAETRHFQQQNLLPAEKTAGNAGNKPADFPEFDTSPARNIAYLSAAPALAALETPELIGRLELLYGGKVGLRADGPVWTGRLATPPDDVLAVMKERRLAVQAVLLARAHAAKTRTREPDSWSADDWRAYFNERAGIREHDGHMPRAMADLEARADCAEEWLRRNSPALDGLGNACWQCGHAGTDADGADPLTNRACRGGVFWLHPRCWADYDRAAQAQAQAALEPIIGGVA